PPAPPPPPPPPPPASPAAPLPPVSPATLPPAPVVAAEVESEPRSAHRPTPPSTAMATPIPMNRPALLDERVACVVATTCPTEPLVVVAVPGDAGGGDAVPNGVETDAAGGLDAEAADTLDGAGVA